MDIREVGCSALHNAAPASENASASSRPYSPRASGGRNEDALLVRFSDPGSNKTAHELSCFVYRHRLRWWLLTLDAVPRLITDQPRLITDQPRLITDQIGFLYGLHKPVSSLFACPAFLMQENVLAAYTVEQACVPPRTSTGPSKRRYARGGAFRAARGPRELRACHRAQ
jgi:hypothetical protein